MTPSDVLDGTYLFLQTIAATLITASLISGALYATERLSAAATLTLFTAALAAQVLAATAAWLAEPTHEPTHPLDQ